MKGGGIINFLFRRGRRLSTHRINVTKNRLMGRKLSLEKSLEKIRSQKDQLKQQAHNVAGKSEARLKELARKYVLLEKQERTLASQAALIDNMVSAIELKAFLQDAESNMKDVEKQFGTLGIGRKEYEELVATIKVTMGETSHAIEEMGSLVDSLTGGDVNLSETEEAFIQEVLAEKEAEEKIGVEQVQKDLEKEKET